MKYYRLDTLGDVSNEDLCFTDQEPEPIGSYDVISGLRLSEEYPDGYEPLTIELGEDHPGLECGSLLGNADAMLILAGRAVEVVLSHEVGDVEVVPITLHDHKGRVHSEDYSIVNPIGSFDCLDLEKSECKRHDDGEIYRILNYVLASNKLEGLPHLFRPSAMPDNYFFSEAVVEHLKKEGCTNLQFHLLEQS